MIDLIYLIYQPTLDTDKGNDYVLSWKSKGVFNSKLKPLYTAFLNSIKLSEYRTGIKSDKDPLAIAQNNYLTKIINVHIVYNLSISNLRIPYLEQLFM